MPKYAGEAVSGRFSVRNDMDRVKIIEKTIYFVHLVI